MDNTTYFNAAQYDINICKVIPYYDELHEQILSLIKALGMKNIKWLDTGCGSGTFVKKAMISLDVSHFTLCDPSEKMLSLAREKLADSTKCSFDLCSSENLKYENSFDVVTAIQSHHYLDIKTRQKAVECCYKALKAGSLFVTFENFAPFSEQGEEIIFNRLGDYQLSKGQTKESVASHLGRYGKEFFPITISEHISLLKECGFTIVEVLWVSYMQAGFYAIK